MSQDVYTPAVSLARTLPATKILLLFVVALALRLGAVFLFPVVPTSDAGDYHTLGVALAEGRGFVQSDGRPNTFRPPFYPLVLGGVYRLAGPHPVAAQLLQTVLDLATCALLWWWARRRFGERMAFWTLVLAATSLSMVASVRILLSECLSAFLATATIVAFDLIREGGRWRRWAVVVGGLAAALTLTRAIMSLLPAVLIGLMSVNRSTRRLAPMAAGLMLSTYALLLAPWMIRNRLKVGSAVITTQGGITFYSSYFRNPGQPYGVNTEDATVLAAKALDPVSFNRTLTDTTLSRLREHPSLFWKAIPAKLFWLLVPFDWEVIGNRVFNATYFASAILLLIGLRPLFAENPWGVTHALTPLFLLAGMAIVFYGSPRFRLPAEPLLLIVAARGAIAGVDWMKART
jgi:4-amino-4-deoxy-L-arabinose transferase-like glycosyltransferase